MDFLYSNRIDDTATLEARRRDLQLHLKSLIAGRRKLYSQKEKAAKLGDRSWETSIRSELGGINKEIRQTKKKLELCDAVYTTSDRVIAGVELTDKKPKTDPVKSKKNSLSL